MLSPTPPQTKAYVGLPACKTDRSCMLFEAFLGWEGRDSSAYFAGVLKGFMAHSLKTTSIYLHHFRIIYSQIWTQYISPGLYYP